MKSRQTDLTTGNLLHNLIILALPIMASNLVQTLYTVTDAFWLGKLTEGARDAVAAVGISFPLIFFLQSFGFGFVISGNSLIAQYKGAGLTENLKKVTGQYVLIMLAFSAFFLVVSLSLLDNILSWLHTPAEIMDVTRDYMSIIIPAQVFMFIFISIQSFYHGVGDTVNPMKIQMISVGINLVIDPLMIFGIWIFPEMGVLGAAYATLFARILAALMAVISLATIHKELLPNLKDIIPDIKMLKKIISISIPASFGHSMTSFGFVFLQSFVNSFGTLVISTNMLSMRIQSLFMMPALGISTALSAVIGQNLGAREVQRAKESVGIALKLVVSIMAVGGATIFFFGGSIIKVFIDDPAVIALGAQVMKITCFTSLVFAIVFVFLGVFNGSGHTKSTMVINIARLWAFRIPLVFILSGAIMNYWIFAKPPLTGIFTVLAYPLRERPYFALWYAMLVSNILSATWAYIIYRKGKWQKAKIHS
ncbi:MAG: MATE family efflux transporter [Candidatus Stygibacter australis]|nr:MATE family efflux transporter [Candidatus Stygibacter australis]MDP8322444.1 MATE family efflux transporter [Candidatus Stygibacter australis]